ncbi:hypothetical protein TrRE_jg290 [Triparma retinervis]|uniref:Uncharacterized protein n=1 Tax=Triparma retinervis TaxID=2557542 RepID=A0A9W7AD63_9STRA|nr:hypothetical protein TrRE_jg290 [Triparma retinervis]
MRYLDMPSLLSCRLVSTEWRDTSTSRAVVEGNTALVSGRMWMRYPEECLLTYARLFGRALTRLELDSGGGSSSWGLSCAQLAFVLHDACPNVTELYLRQCGYIESDELTVLAQMGRLTKFEIKDITIDCDEPDEFLNVVRCNPGLVDLGIDTEFFYNAPLVAEVLEAAPQLESLFVNLLPSCDDTLALAAHPSLRTLDFGCVDLKNHHLDEIELLSDTVEEIDFAYSLGGIEPRRFLEFVQAMPKLRVASFLGIDEEEYALGWSEYHPDWIAAQSIINQRIPSDKRILRWGGVVDKSGGPAPAYNLVFA